MSQQASAKEHVLLAPPVETIVMMVLIVYQMKMKLMELAWNLMFVQKPRMMYAMTHTKLLLVQKHKKPSVVLPLVVALKIHSGPEAHPLVRQHADNLAWVSRMTEIFPRLSVLLAALFKISISLVRKWQNFQVTHMLLIATMTSIA